MLSVTQTSLCLVAHGAKMPVSLWLVSTASGRQPHERSLESPVRSRLFVGSIRGQVKDLRIMSDVRDSDGRRFLPVLDIVKLLREALFKNWPIDGPRTAREFMLAVRASGIEGFISYRNVA